MSLFAAVAPLALVLGLLGGLLWWLRRAARSRAAAGRQIRLVETVDLGPGQRLHLIEWSGRGLLVASTSQRCELLCEMETLPAEQPAEQSSWAVSLAERMRK